MLGQPHRRWTNIKKTTDGISFEDGMADNIVTFSIGEKHFYAKYFSSDLQNTFYS